MRAASPKQVSGVLGQKASPTRPEQVRVSADAARLVATIGSQLDRSIWPEVFDGGIVAPNASAIPFPVGVENSHDRTRASEVPFGSRSPGTGARPWSSREGTVPARASGATSPVARADVRSRYEQQLASVHAAYPNTCVWSSDDGFWLLTESSVVAGLTRAAIFLTAVSSSFAAVKSWGFWRESVVCVKWMGPRHTNFPEGSVCAFDPKDRTWIYGDSLVGLLDLYSVWALRHLHLELFRRWPGPQSVPHPYERRIELQPNELCGCSSCRRYQQCCQSRDAARDFIPDAVNFAMIYAGGVREPPPNLGQVILGRETPPSLSTLRWQ